MRKKAHKNGVRLKAYAGTTGIMLAMDLDEKPREDFLGWAIQKQYGLGVSEWLSGMIPFPHMEHKDGELIPSNIAPLQKFRWTDYGVNPSIRYRYVVHPVYGDPKQPTIEPGPSVTVETQSSTQGEHTVFFNRAAAASQAFARKFQTINQRINESKSKKNVAMSPDALVWLSRGAKEAIVSFIERAKDSTWALDVAIYQYELDDIVEAVDAAHRRKVNVRVVYHAKKNDKQTAKNEESLARIPKAKKRARLTSKICHHKFIVLSRIAKGVKTPVAVLCGSTNFTHNGVYRQANIVHVVSRSDVAEQYLKLFDELFAGNTPAETRKFNDENNPIETGVAFYVGFSPRSQLKDLEQFIADIKAAKRDVLFCTAFDLYDGVKEALLGSPHDRILRFGVQDKSGQKNSITGFHADRTADFEAAAMLSEGLEGFLKESLKGAGGTGSILIHTKLIVLDFTSDSPTVISGSHNFSRPASEGNDENFMIIKGNTDIADSYGCELMRIYDHYRFRYSVKRQLNAGKKLKRIELRPDGSWTKRYYKKNSLWESDRVLFAGGNLDE
jgi:phosphatidylserine/phosphatidylglycerophosphate/cardiolipin synthase-like enzyme